MDSLFGITGDGWVLLAADSTAARSILTFKHDEDKIMELDASKMMSSAGEVGDRIQFSEYIQKNMALHELRTGIPLDTDSTAHYIRGELATALRSRPYQVNCLIAGFDTDAGAGLYFLDYLSTMQKMNFAAHGYAGYFCYSLLDRHWKPKMTLAEGTALLRKCIKELHTRFMLSQPHFTVKVADKDGIRTIDLAPEE
mmetsp:Transcript_92205/g.256647  ORF Transcript_92205/g.256647 Transcript_92205/m.256647 type:complete len:197 (+) Transcript_92205:169-759(+)